MDQPRPRGGGPLGRLGVGVGDGDHVAFAYWSRGELLDVMTACVQDGIDENEMVVHAADDIATAVARAELLARGVAVEAEERAGRLSITTARELLLPGGRFDPAAARARILALGALARAAGLARLRLCTEMTYLLSGAPGLEDTLEFQARLDEDVGAGFPLVRLSAFNTTREVTDLAADVLRVHPVLISHGLPLANPYYRPWSELRTGYQPWPARAG